VRRFCRGLAASLIGLCVLASVLPITRPKVPMNAIELIHVSKVFGGRRAVDNLNLSVPEGTIYGFIGPNGAGKTSSIRMILRIFRPDSGIIKVLGSERGEAADDRVGYLPEERGLYKKMQVNELLRFHAQLKGLRDCRRAVADWVERMGLTHVAERQVQTLSKGMSQKIQFIAAVIGEPRLLILDEPFSGLDPVNMELVQDAILDLKRRGTTILLSTHDMCSAERMCDAICMIFRGQKVLDGTLRSIQDRYGGNMLRVRTQEGIFLNELPGVVESTERPHYQELHLATDADPQVILRAIAARAHIEHFELAKPSLHDIFVRIVRTDVGEPLPEPAGV
jgi:ABC-2 type transport system ATP-binding protein